MTDCVKNTPRTRVELHAHLDGCVRRSTLYELMKRKSLALPGDGSFIDFETAVVVRDPIDLGHFLKPFSIYLPCLQNDLVACERIAYEFCEDKAKNHVAYVEARYSPHGFLTPEHTTFESLTEVVKAIHRGLQRGEKDFNIKTNTILCTLIGTDKAVETLKLCETLRDHGVVAIDTAAIFDKTHQQDEVPLNSKEALVYQEAAKLGIHRTVHAGERGPAEMVRRAVDVYQTERVGHGYHVVEDDTIYSHCKNKNIHFECCPWSSFLTGAVPLDVKKHPIVRFVEDNVNFSLSTDDTTITGKGLADDYNLVSEWGLTEVQSVRTCLNAARSAFLPPDEKQALVARILKGCGFDD